MKSFTLRPGNKIVFSTYEKSLGYVEFHGIGSNELRKETALLSLHGDESIEYLMNGENWSYAGKNQLIYEALVGSKIYYRQPAKSMEGYLILMGIRACSIRLGVNGVKDILFTFDKGININNEWVRKAAVIEEAWNLPSPDSPKRKTLKMKVDEGC